MAVGLNDCVVAGTADGDVDVRYEAICVLDWLPSPVISFAYSSSLRVYVELSH